VSAPPGWGARKIRERLILRFSEIKITVKSTIHAVLDRHGLVERRGRLRRAQGTSLSLGQKPNELWFTDYKGDFLLGNHQYCTKRSFMTYSFKQIVHLNGLRQRAAPRSPKAGT